MSLWVGKKENKNVEGVKIRKKKKTTRWKECCFIILHFWVEFKSNVMSFPSRESVAF